MLAKIYPVNNKKKKLLRCDEVPISTYMAVQFDSQLFVQGESKGLKHQSLPTTTPSPMFSTVLTTFTIIKKSLILPQ